MMEDAMMIAAKISGAEAVDLYDIKMENATIIRKCARELFEEDIKDKEYIELLPNEIEEFRLLFIDWVASFDQWNYIIDRWELFNPPGVSAHDKDPDDDIPFNPKDFFEGMDFDDEEE
jgi:hypothetical protein